MVIGLPSGAELKIDLGAGAVVDFCTAPGSVNCGGILQAMGGLESATDIQWIEHHRISGRRSHVVATLEFDTGRAVSAECGNVSDARLKALQHPAGGEDHISRTQSRLVPEAGS